MLFVEACEGAASRYVTQLYKGLAAFCTEKNSVSNLLLYASQIVRTIQKQTYLSRVLSRLL
jgi:hypothetical protein